MRENDLVISKRTVGQTGFYVCPVCESEQQIVVPRPLYKGQTMPQCNKHGDIVWVLVISTN